MSSTATIPIPARVADVAVRTPAILHTDEAGEFVVMRDAGPDGRPYPGRILAAAGLDGPCWVRLVGKRDYRVATWHSGAAAGLVGFRFEALTVEEAEEELSRQIADRLEREVNRPHIGGRAPVKPDRRSQAEREAAGDDSPPEPARQGPRSRPIGTHREPAPDVEPARAPLVRPTGIANQTERGTGPASIASTPAEHVPTWDSGRSGR